MTCLTIVIGLSVSAAHGASNCTIPDNQCTRVVGCVLGEPNEIFIGEVIGVQSGHFSTKTNLGAVCTGTFRRTNFGTAKVKATCNDGRRARATFTYYHKQTGTGRGKGRMSNGNKIVFWAGNRMLNYFENIQESRMDEFVTCAMGALQHDAAKDQK
ncbi:hypothetical protein J7382_08180 [Shimia sp. R11_0]|uniref:hypothetical protein n=1 Tax=Shimia sp. R11_0 TaxID=2821096 RepID=UPI001ADD0BE8|nr:hypothetical protein [Shimia sp. R11_0]MBO9477506.1 hypothetical protein [Shimia sp. R11_0]